MKNPIYKGQHLKPVDGFAAKIVTQKGTHFISAKKIDQRHWESPPRTIKISPSSGEEDLTGITFGRFTVIGKYSRAQKNGNSSRALWLVRCSCGDYETRRSKSIKNKNNNKDCCDNCRQIEFLKSRSRDLK